jgi:biopolymer transport protein TolR
MGMGSSQNRGSGGRKYTPMAEINVTPFIDVMLVLLIVFMVTAPLLNAGVQIDLPKSDAAAIHDDNDKPIEVSFDKEGQIYLGEQVVTRDELITKLSALANNDVEKRIFIRADQNLPYGDVMGVIGLINKAGYRKVALISNPSGSSRN